MKEKKNMTMQGYITLLQGSLQDKSMFKSMSSICRAVGEEKKKRETSVGRWGLFIFKGTALVEATHYEKVSELLLNE